MEREFTVSEEGIERHLNHMGIWVRLLPLVAICAGFALAVRRSDEIEPTSTIVGIIAIIFLGILIHQRVPRLIRQQLESVVITLSESAIERHQKKAPDVRIEREHVSRITENALGLTVLDETAHERIFVPSGLIGYDIVRDQLAAWRAIEPGADMAALSRKVLPIFIVGMIAFCSLIAFDTPAIVVPCGVIVGGLAIWSLIHFRYREPSLVEKRRRPVVILFTLLILGNAVARIVMVLKD